jgi:hypothetical protein
MLTRLIVNCYAWIIEISLWLTLLVSGVVGYHFTVPILNAAGLIPANEGAWKIYGALFCLLATFLVLAVFIGPLLVLLDIRTSVRALETASAPPSSSSAMSLFP